MSGNKPTMVVRVGEGFVKTVDGVEQTNNLGFPLWKEKGNDTNREIEMDAAAFADILQANWSILTTDGQTRKKRLYQFLQAIGWAVYDAAPIFPPVPTRG